MATPSSAPTRTLRGALFEPILRIPDAKRRRLFVIFFVIAAALFPLIDGNDGDIDAAANACSFAVLALGLNIVVGFAGLLDLGYAAFFAIGAYAYGILSSYQVQPVWSDFWLPFQWLGLVARIAGDGAGAADLVHFTFSFWIMLPLSAVIAAFFGILFGAPTLRLKGDYLAIVTLGFGEIVPIVARNTPYLTNGSMGLNGVAPPVLFGYRFGVESLPYYYVGLVMIIVLIFVSYRLKDSRIGRAWMAIREDEIAAGAMGVNRVKLKLLAFAIGAGFAGSTGVLYVACLVYTYPSPRDLSGSRMRD
jgi:branched-chain amino acid transport system permease protein